MAMQQHVESLKAKHHRLDELINQEMLRPMPDQCRVSQMKREKLKLKEMIESCTGEPHPTVDQASPQHA